MQTIPKTLQPKATALLNHILNSERVGVSNIGEVSVDGRLVPGSNIIDLINDFTRSRKKQPTTGFEELASVLRDGNIPREYIGNVELWDLISGERGKSLFTSQPPNWIEHDTTQPLSEISPPTNFVQETPIKPTSTQSKHDSFGRKSVIQP